MGAAMVVCLVAGPASLPAFFDMLVNAAVGMAADKAAEVAAEKITSSAYMQSFFGLSLSPDLGHKPRKFLPSKGFLAQGAVACTTTPKADLAAVASILSAAPAAEAELENVRVVLVTNGKKQIYWFKKNGLVPLLLDIKPHLEGQVLVVGDFGRCLPLAVRHCHWAIPTVPGTDLKSGDRVTRITDDELAALLQGLTGEDDLAWIPDAEEVFAASRGVSPAAMAEAKEADLDALTGVAAYYSFTDAALLAKYSQKEYYWDRPRAKSVLPRGLIGDWGDGKGFRLVIRQDKTVEFFSKGSSAGRTECMVTFLKKKNLMHLAFLVVEDTPPEVRQVKLNGDVLEFEKEDGFLTLTRQ